MIDPLRRLPGHKRVAAAFWLLTLVSLAAMAAFALR